MCQCWKVLALEQVVIPICSADTSSQLLSSISIKVQGKTLGAISIREGGCKIFHCSRGKGTHLVGKGKSRVFLSAIFNLSRQDWVWKCRIRLTGMPETLEVHRTSEYMSP